MSNKTLSTLSTNKVELGSNYLQVVGQMNDAELSDTFSALSSMQGSTLFWLGDFLASVETSKGEAYAKVYAETDYSPSTLYNAKSVCKKIPKASRVNLPYNHHKEALIETKGDAALAVKFLYEVATRPDPEDRTVKKMRDTIRFALATNKQPAVSTKQIVKDDQLVLVLDALAFVRRFLETADSTTLDIRKAIVRSEVEAIYDLAQKVCV